MTEATCGKGLAENAALPSKLAELTRALATILELHQTSLDLTEPAGREERDAYVKLATEFSAIASTLNEIADQMRSYENLPMASHDETALAAPENIEAFATFVRIERELVALLQRRVSQHEEMLAGTG